MTEKPQGSLQGTEARHIGVSQAVKVEHLRHRKLVERWFVASIRGVVVRQPLFDAPSRFPRCSLP